MVSFLAFATTLQQSVRTVQLYGTKHPRSQQSIALLGDTFTHHLAERPHIQVAAKNGRLFVDKVMEEGLNLQLKALIHELEERDIHAFVAHQGVTPDEWTSFLELLGMKPQKIRSEGGARAWLEKQGAQRLRILATRLEDVTDSGEVAAAILGSLALPEVRSWAASGLSQALAESAAGAEPGPSAQGVSGGEPSGVPGGQGLLGIPGRRQEVGTGAGAALELLRGRLLGLLQGPQVPDLSTLGDHLAGAGLDRNGTSPATQGVLAQAVTSLPAEGRLGIFLGAAQLRPGTLRQVLTRLAGQQALPAVAEACARGSLAPGAIPEVLDDLASLLPDGDRLPARLAQALRQSGLGPAEVEELLEAVTWGTLPRAERLKRLMEKERLAEIPLVKVLALLRELLEAGDIPGFVRLLNRLGEDLALPVVERRMEVARGMVQIAKWTHAPGMPDGVMDVLVGILCRAWQGERDPEVHGQLSQALEVLIWFDVARGRARQAVARVDDLAEVSREPEWKTTSLEELLQRLAAPGRMAHLLTLLHGLDKAEAATQLHPWLKRLAGPAADFLVERLADEGDRLRRARLLDALRACGQTAEAPLLEALRSGEWFVVRNALIVLGEVAGPAHLPQVLPLLRHPDPRVVRAAIRTVARVGGAQAEPAILALLPEGDLETQLEVLFVVQELRSKAAVPSLLDFLKQSQSRRRELVRVREKVVEVLGTLGSASVIPVLDQLLTRRRSFFVDKTEPLAVRLAALQALLDLNTPEAQDVAARALETEPPGPDREALQGLVLTQLQG